MSTLWPSTVRNVISFSVVIPLILSPVAVQYTETVIKPFVCLFPKVPQLVKNVKNRSLLIYLNQIKLI